jgi:HEAT repeat protein
MTTRRSLVLLCLAVAVTSALAGAADEEAKLIGVLRSDAKVFDKAKACQRLAAIGTKRAVPALAALLGHEQLGGYARFGLEPIQHESVDAALRDALSKLGGRLRTGVINSLGVRRDAKAVPALKTLAAGGSEEAIWALGQIASDEAVAALKGLLGGDHREAAAHACLAAAQLRGGPVASELCDAVRKAKVASRLQAAAAYQRMMLPGGVKLLVAALRGDDADTRAMALRAAREAKGQEMTAALVAELGGARPAVQAALIQVLVSRGDRRSAKGIAALTASEAEDVRVEALAALGQIGDVASLAVLLKAASGRGNDARAAGKSLRSIAGDGVDAALVEAIPRADARLKAELASVLADRGCAAAVPALLTEAGGANEKVARASLKALGVLAPPAALPQMVALVLAGKGGATGESAIASVAGRIANPEKRADPLLAATPKTPEAHATRLRILGRIGGTRAFAAVHAALASEDAGMRDAAVRALASWPDDRALPALIDVVKTTKNDVHRVLALRGAVRLLGGSGGDAKPVVAEYAGLLALAKRADERKLVLSGLASVAHPDALSQVMPLLDDPAVRDEAGQATVKIGAAIAGSHRDAARSAMRRVVGVFKRGPVARGARKVLAAIDRFADAITAWRISGPYLQEGKTYGELFDIVFEPEKPDAKDVKWQPITAGTHRKYPQILDLKRALGGDQRAAYALTWVHSEKAQPAQLQLGSDDGVKAWLNGTLVHANNVPRAAIPYTDKVNVTLQKGWNPLLLKITQNNVPWEFCARICQRNGKPLSGLRIDPDHEGEWRLPKAAAKPAPGAAPGPPPMKGTRIHDGKTFAGWEGNREWFRIEDGAIVGGSLKKRIPRNEFLCTTKEYADFQLRLRVKLVNNIGNAGIQVRSRRIPNHHEMIGYQADIGKVYWGAIYDESRRRKVLAKPDAATLRKALKKGEWNEYVIRCEGKRIQLWLNGVQTADYTEPDPKIPQTGIIGLQIHSGRPSEIWYKDIEIVELP